MEILLFYSRITAVLVLLLLILRNSSCSICEIPKPNLPTQCDKGSIGLLVEKINDGSFNESTAQCTPATRYTMYNPASKDISEVLSELNANQCYTKETPLQLGLNISWIMNITDERMSQLKLVVAYNQYQPFYHTLDLDLSQLLKGGEVTKFSTKCIPFEGAENGHSYTVYAEDYNEGILTGPTVNIIVDCNEIYIQRTYFCPVIPAQRPEATSFCNKTVSVNFTPEPPSTIGDRLQYSVIICLFRGERVESCEQKTLNATVGKPSAPKVYFHNVTAGTYKASFAFLNDHHQPCGNHYYKAKDTFKVEDPPEVAFQTERQACDKLFVNLTIAKLPEQKSMYKRGQLCLYEENTQIECDPPTMAFETMKNKVFTVVSPGTYHVQFEYLDPDDHPCIDNASFTSDEYVFEDCEGQDGIFKFNAVVVGFSTPSAVLVCVLCFVILLVLFKRRRHEQTTLKPNDFDSVSGMIIIGPECSQPAEYRVNEPQNNGRKAHENLYVENPSMKSQTRNYTDSGLPPSMDELPSIHDGKSRIISI